MEIHMHRKIVGQPQKSEQMVTINKEFLHSLTVSPIAVSKLIQNYCPWPLLQSSTIFVDSHGVTQHLALPSSP